MNKKFEVYEVYEKITISEIQPYGKDEDIYSLYVNEQDDPEIGMGMIVRNPLNYKDQRYVSRKYFRKNFRKAKIPSMSGKLASSSSRS